LGTYSTTTVNNIKYERFGKIVVATTIGYIYANTTNTIPSGYVPRDSNARYIAATFISGSYPGAAFATVQNGAIKNTTAYAMYFHAVWVTE